MRFSLQREVLLKPLAQVVNVVERRQTLPVLANLLAKVRDGQLSLTGTDLEVEMVSRTAVDDAQDGEITIPARKLFEIVRALPDGSKVTVSQNGDKVTVQAGRSRFSLASLPGERFPVDRRVRSHRARERRRKPALKELIERTAFAMAQQDVRYYLNGLLFDLRDTTLRCVATDGHRLALCETALRCRRRRQAPDHRARARACRNCSACWKAATACSNWSWAEPHPGQARRCHLHQQADRRQVPGLRSGDPDRRRPEVKIDREAFRAALQRASILSNEKYRGVPRRSIAWACSRSVRTTPSRKKRRKRSRPTPGRRAGDRLQRQLPAGCAQRPAR